jgi:hypothetical protein
MPNTPRPRWQRLLFALFGITALLALTAFLLIQFFPSTAAQFADPLRAMIGNRGVARVQEVVFQVQDGLRQTEYSLGLAEAEAPWELPTPTIPPTATPTATATTPPTQPANQPTSQPTNQPTSTPAPPTITPTPTPTPWTLPPLTPLGDLVGEGEWVAYLWDDESGEPTAVRTFIQPDPDRPFALAAVIAFDLSRTKLNFVLGTEEPAVADGPTGYGLIPSPDNRPENLLATFNGGFKATHGRFGAIGQGVTALPPRPGYATVVIYQDDSVKLDEWGSDNLPSDNIKSLRQNARLVLQNGEITEQVYNNSVEDWGGTIDYNIVTWRSGLGLNAEENILYFFAGPSLSMPALATAMQTAGVNNGLLLDINESWVHFAAHQPDAQGGMTSEPIFPDVMSFQPNRYLFQSTRDFFYIARKP